MGLTPGGLPFPEGTDFVVDGDNAIRALAEAIDTRLGMVPIRPAAVTGEGVTILANGAINFGSSARAFRVDGAFTNRFRRYRIIADWSLPTTESGVGATFRLSSGGVVDDSTNYHQQSILGANATATANRSLGQNFWSAVGAIAYEFQMDMTVAGPADPNRNTKCLNQWSAVNSNYAAGTFGLLHGVLKAFDGFEFALSGNGIFQEGQLMVYGLA